MGKETNGVFLNGRAQIVEMLQIMPAQERDRLLKNIRQRNPSLAQELNEESISFSYIYQIPDSQMTIAFKYINPNLFGIALKGVEVSRQRKFLSLAPRDYAEQAFRALTSNLPNEARDMQRAQAKITKIMLELIKRGQISTSA